MGDIYFTPQQKIIAQVGNREQYVQQECSAYINDSNKGSNATPSRNNHVNRDEYMLPPQDREDTPEIRPRKEKKENVLFFAVTNGSVGLSKTGLLFCIYQGSEINVTGGDFGKSKSFSIDLDTLAG